MAKNLQKAILGLIGEEESNLPNPLTFSKSVVVRTPALWLLLFERRDVGLSSFVTDDDSPGDLTRAFEHGARRCFGNDDDIVRILSSDMELLLAELSAYFVALGSLYCFAPMPSVEELEEEEEYEAAIDESVQTLLRMVSPQLRGAAKVLRAMNAAFLSDRGAGGDKYLLSRTLDPALFSAGDREAVKKATTSKEHPTFGRPSFKEGGHRQARKAAAKTA